MCGIAGSHNKQVVVKALEKLFNRGKDACVIDYKEGFFLGHNLHSVVGFVKQPLRRKGMLVFNGEIYNWKLLKKHYDLSCSNDAELLLYLLDEFGVDKTRDLIDGVYAYAYVRDGVVVLERDLLGVKPLFYSTKSFSFASEAKALEGSDVRILHPRTTIFYDLKTKTLSSKVRPFNFNKPSISLDEALLSAVKKRIPDNNKVAVLFSGGVDSSLIAKLLKDLGADVSLYVAVVLDPDKKIPHDLLSAKQSAELLNLPLNVIEVSLSDVKKEIPFVCNLIEDSNVVKVGVALPFLFCCRRASLDGHKVVFSGLGAEEVFAGYNRHLRASDINKECVRGLRMLYERDLYRDDVVSMSCGLELRLPFLDHELISVGLGIPSEEKIVDGITKYPLRKAALRFGLSQEVAFRPKKAAQYGSGFDAAIKKLASANKQSKSEYLSQFLPSNGRLATLLSSGKDSVYATYLMQKRNYDVVCSITVVSDNPHSYMYHTPLVSAAKLQSEAMGMDNICVRTSGVKEEELSALKEAIRLAIDKYGITGVVSGALFSDYQRSRIEAIAEELGIVVHSPLWHLDQEQEIREIIDAGFVFVFSRVAADGLDASWLNKPITHDDVDKLKDLLFVNIAGEGGEFESLVLDGPNFSFSLQLINERIVSDSNSFELQGVCVQCGTREDNLPRN